MPPSHSGDAAAPSIRGADFLVAGRVTAAGGKAAHGGEGLFLDALQPAGFFGVCAVEIDAVADELRHGNALTHGLVLKPLQLFGVNLNLRSDHTHLNDNRCIPL